MPHLWRAVLRLPRLQNRTTVQGLHLSKKMKAAVADSALNDREIVEVSDIDLKTVLTCPRATVATVVPDTCSFKPDFATCQNGLGVEVVSLKSLPFGWG